MQGEVRAAQQRAQDLADQMELMQHKYEQQLRVLRVESEGQIQLFKDRWSAEFEKRKRLHNQVRPRGGREGGGIFRLRM